MPGAVGDGLFRLATEESIKDGHKRRPADNEHVPALEEGLANDSGGGVETVVQRLLQGAQRITGDASHELVEQRVADSEDQNPENARDRQRILPVENMVRSQVRRRSRRRKDASESA